MDYAIKVEKLGKEYRLGQTVKANMLREAIVDLFRRPFGRKKRQYETIWALRDIDFAVPKGQVVGIIGRNGAGKSTLLKVLSRITCPTVGSMHVQGRVASLLEVGTGFHEELTGRENIYLNGSILGMTKKEIDAKLDAIVEFAGVRKFLETPIKRFSSGMWLRLGFAVAAHLDPDVLLVDEVLAVGDVEFQRKCLAAMDGLSKTGGRTVLFVSHNMAAVENLCTRAIWIDGGRIRMDGDSTEVIKAYMATFAGMAGGTSSLDRADGRKGTGEVRFTDLEFLDARGEPMPVIRSGDAVTVRMHYQVNQRVQMPHFGLEIYTALGTKVSELSTWNSSYSVPVMHPGKGHMDLAIGCLNLMPGRYYLTLWLESVGDLDYDILENCATIDIETSNFLNSGKGMDARLGIVCLPCTWTLSNGHGRPLMEQISREQA